MKGGGAKEAGTPSPERFFPAVPLAVALLVYLRTAGHGTILLDDASYLANSLVPEGLTPRSVAWAFTSFHASNWHPLTWLSHMADVSLFGMRPGAMHLVNALLHGANGVLFYTFLRRATGEPWKALFAASLFAAHPVHVESVAWIAERKDLLSALFFLLSLHGWLRYAERPSTGRYAAVAALFALALMAKPMAVTLPFVLLLLDAWPLGRSALAPPAIPYPDGAGAAPLPAWRLLLEKAPLLALSAASCAVTLLAQARTAAAMGSVPPVHRLLNALASVAAYLGKLVFPYDLAVLYPMRPYDGILVAKGAAAAALAVAATLLFLRERKGRPYLLVGWLWLLGMLVPVLGFVQVGTQAMADRYAYLPFLGLYVAAAWGIPGIVPAALRRGRALAAAGALAVSALAAAAFVQAGYWKGSETLFLRSLDATEGNFLLQNNLGIEYGRQGRLPEALARFAEAVRIKPDYYLARHNAGEALYRMGRREEALEALLEAHRLRPYELQTLVALGEVSEEMGLRDDAAGWFRRALEAAPGNPYALEGLARLGAAPR